ncbi:MAG: DUF2148 domain-containing protein [Planctomycetes bacterium]|nr:DUF2148 domain-containing protein [Planctomycetota bacterium]
MLYKEEEIREEAVQAIAREVMLAIRTSPKTRGLDNLSIVLATGDDIKRLAGKMDELNQKSGGQRPSFSRDAKGVELSQAVVVVGVKAPPYGLNCGWCGYPTCEEKAKQAPNVPCVFGPVDIGIGVGVAAAKLGEKHIDNRLMFSIGMAVLELGWFDKDVTIALGYPLSVSGKNIFFDRK